MTILFVEGVDNYDSVTDAITGTDITRSGANATFSTTGGRFGTACFTMNNLSSYFQFPLAKAQNSTVFVTFAWRSFNTVTNGYSVLMEFIDSGGGVIGSLRYHHTGRLVFRPQNGAAGDVDATGLPLTANVWHSVEVRFVNGSTSSNGACEVLVDGIQVINASSVDTNNGATTLTNVRIYGHSDDIILSDNASSGTFLGDVRVENIRPTSDGGVADWTASAGSDFQCVDDALGASNGDTDYIFSNTVAQKTRFGMGDLSGSRSAIPAVQVRAKVAKTDAGAQTYRSYLRSNGTEANGTTLTPPTTTYEWDRNQLAELDPDGSVAWTVTSVNALEVGVELVS